MAATLAAVLSRLLTGAGTGAREARELPKTPERHVSAAARLSSAAYQPVHGGVLKKQPSLSDFMAESWIHWNPRVNGARLLGDCIGQAVTTF